MDVGIFGLSKKVGTDIFLHAWTLLYNASLQLTESVGCSKPHLSGLLLHERSVVVGVF